MVQTFEQQQQELHRKLNYRDFKLKTSWNFKKKFFLHDTSNTTSTNYDINTFKYYYQYYNNNNNYDNDDDDDDKYHYHWWW